MPALQDIIVDEPETARQEGAFALGQAIASVFRLVSQHEFAVDQKLSLDCLKRSSDTRIGRRKKAYEGEEQQAGVQPLRAVDLHKAVKVGIETALTDFDVDFICNSAPATPCSVRSRPQV